MKDKFKLLFTFLLKPMAFLAGFLAGITLFWGLLFGYSIYYLLFAPYDYLGYMDIVDGELVSSDQFLTPQRPHYSIAYSEERFDKVEKGMAIQDVLDLLGYPLHKRYDQDRLEESWIYGDYYYRLRYRYMIREIIIKDLNVERIEKKTFLD